MHILIVPRIFEIFAAIIIATTLLFWPVRICRRIADNELEKAYVNSKECALELHENLAFIKNDTVVQLLHISDDLTNNDTNNNITWLNIRHDYHYQKNNSNSICTKLGVSKRFGVANQKIGSVAAHLIIPIVVAILTVFFSWANLLEFISDKTDLSLSIQAFCGLICWLIISISLTIIDYNWNGTEKNWRNYGTNFPFEWKICKFIAWFWVFIKIIELFLADRCENIIIKFEKRFTVTTVRLPTDYMFIDENAPPYPIEYDSIDRIVNLMLEALNQYCKAGNELLFRIFARSKNPLSNNQKNIISSEHADEMVERSAGTKAKRLLLKNAQSLEQVNETANLDPITLIQADIPQLNNNDLAEYELFDIAKSTLIKLFALRKYETYRNSDRCFRIFLLAMKFLSDTIALKMFNVFYSNKIFTQLADFYICWAQRSDNHNFIRDILIKAEKMDAQPKCILNIRKRQFAKIEEELILSQNDSGTLSSEAKTTDSLLYPWNIQQQTDLMNNMRRPKFIKFYSKKMPPFNFIFRKLSFPRLTSNSSLNYICSLNGIPNHYFILKMRSKHQSHWEAYIYHFVEEQLNLISGIIQIYHCSTFTDKCLTVQEFTAGTLKELIIIQECGEIKLSELMIAIVVLDLMKILRSLHQLNIIHGCFRNDNIFIAKRIEYRPQLSALVNGTTLLVKIANWDFAIRHTDGIKYDGEFINENKVITDGIYRCEPWNYEIDKMGLVNVVNELINNRTLDYLQCKSGRYVPLLNLKKEWSMGQIWVNLFRKCLGVELHPWDELIDVFAHAIDTCIREREDWWIRSCVDYNFLFRQLFRKNSQFYP